MSKWLTCISHNAGEVAFFLVGLGWAALRFLLKPVWIGNRASWLAMNGPNLPIGAGDSLAKPRNWLARCCETPRVFYAGAGGASRAAWPNWDRHLFRLAST